MLLFARKIQDAQSSQQLLQRLNQQQPQNQRKSMTRKQQQHPAEWTHDLVRMKQQLNQHAHRPIVRHVKENPSAVVRIGKHQHMVQVVKDAVLNLHMAVVPTITIQLVDQILKDVNVNIRRTDVVQTIGLQLEAMKMLAVVVNMKSTAVVQTKLHQLKVKRSAK